MIVANVTAAPDWCAEVCRSEDGSFSVFLDGVCIASDVRELADAERIASQHVAGSGPGEHAVVTRLDAEGREVAS